MWQLLHLKAPNSIHFTHQYIKIYFVSQAETEIIRTDYMSRTGPASRAVSVNLKKFSMHLHGEIHHRSVK